LGRRTVSGGIEILLITSRETKRFIIPKGWTTHLKESWKSAEIEARQEAAIIGKIKRQKIGQHSY
jgi:hypothetical protein